MSEASRKSATTSHYKTPPTNYPSTPNNVAEALKKAHYYDCLGFASGIGKNRDTICGSKLYFISARFMERCEETAAQWKNEFQPHQHDDFLNSLKLEVLLEGLVIPERQCPFWERLSAWLSIHHKMIELTHYYGDNMVFSDPESRAFRQEILQYFWMLSDTCAFTCFGGDPGRNLEIDFGIPTRHIVDIPSSMLFNVVLYYWLVEGTAIPLSYLNELAKKFYGSDKTIEAETIDNEPEKICEDPIMCFQIVAPEIDGTSYLRSEDCFLKLNHKAQVYLKTYLPVIVSPFDREQADSHHQVRRQPPLSQILDGSLDRIR